MKTLSLVLSFLTLGLMLARADANLKGAEVILQELDKAKPATGNGKSAKLGEDFKKKLVDFKTSLSDLSPAESAEIWLGLTRNWLEIKQSGINFTELLEALPDPKVWPELRKQLAAHPTGNPANDQMLALLVETLNNAPEKRWEVFQKISKMAVAGKASSVMSSKNLLASQLTIQQLPEMAAALVKLTDDPDQLVKLLEIQITPPTIPGFNNHRSSVSFPPLVARVGADRLRKLFAAAVNSGTSVEVAGREDRNIARLVMLENVEKLESAPWKLVSDIDPSSLTLFDALVKKFPPDSRNGYERQQAEGFHLLGLIAAKKIDAARVFAVDANNSQVLRLPYHSGDLMAAAGAGVTYFQFIANILATNPELPLWDEYVSLAALNHKTGEMVERARKSSEREGLNAEQRNRVMTIYGNALLAHNSTEEGIANLRERIALFKKDTSKKDEKQSETVFEISMNLYKLGKVLKREDLKTEGIREAMASGYDDDMNNFNLRGLLPALKEQGRYTEAEKLLADVMQRKLTKPKNDWQKDDLQFELTNLAALYDLQNRPEDVIYLLQNARWWNASDLSKIVVTSHVSGTTLGSMAARAFKATGNPQKALEILQTTIRKTPKDANYAMLVEMEGDKALPFLDELFARDQFEERPLIWKATLQLKDGKVDEANETIRRAIAIDPSDGETGKGDRMRAYAVLADVLDAQGKTDDAKTYRGAVEAIRISEDADDFRAAGLLSKAVEMYEEALTHFSDAYCIQSRLAIQLTNLGETAKAEEHYRRAFELMPSSFGRMESHCFGCERAFAGEVAETLAERTFRKMLESDPKKPQLHYLLGYLRNEQEKYPEALASFQKAVKLDPDYLNSWKKIIEMDEHVPLTIAQMDEARLNLLRLDPLGNHGRPELDEISDLPRLWQEVEKLQARLELKPLQPIFALAASARQLEKTKATNPNRYNFEEPERTLPSPDGVIAKNVLISQISDWFKNLAMTQN